MIWQKAMKYPVLVIGFVMFGIFLSDPKTAIWWDKVLRRFKSSTCDTVLVRTEKKAPLGWKMACPTMDKLVLDVPVVSDVANYNQLRVIMYKSLANHLTKFSQVSNPETVIRLKKLQINLNHKRLTIESITTGESVIEFLKLKNQKDIIRHLKHTVKVKEVRK